MASNKTGFKDLSPGLNTSCSQLCVLTFFLPVEVRGGLLVSLLHVLPLIKALRKLGLHASRWLRRVSEPEGTGGNWNEA